MSIGSAWHSEVIPAKCPVGLGLILGCLTTAAAFFALVMDFSYVMAGTISTNALCILLILLGVIIIAAGFNAGRIGLDRWVIPFICKTTAKDHKVSEKISA